MSDADAARPVGTDELIRLVRRLLSDEGPASDDLDRAVLWILQAEVLGARHFGVEMLLRERAGGTAHRGEADPAAGVGAEPSAEPSGAVRRLDAAGVPGILALARATRWAEASARVHGVGIVGVHGAGATGGLGCAARSIAVTGLVGLVLAQSGPVVAPWGGNRAVIGTNPVAIATPRTSGSPLVLDFATSPMTLSDVRRHAVRGEELPPGVALDDRGRPTTDPAAVAALVPGDRLASLVGLLAEVLAGVAVGSAPDPADGPRAPRGLFVMALDPARTGSTDAAELTALLAARWGEGGGHVPGRLDELADGLDGLPPTIAVVVGTLDRLRDAVR